MRNFSWSKAIKINCKYCLKLIFEGQMIRHENQCHLNPINLRYCIFCKIEPVKQKNALTCSYSCSNKQFRTGPDHGNWKEDAYVTTCFHYHEKKCVVCGEYNIVEVHHLDQDKANNDPSNLIPLCSTHHRYWHSRFKPLIETAVLSYIENWKNNRLTILTG